MMSPALTVSPFAHAHFEDAPASLGSDGGIVAFDAAADGDDAVGDRRRGEEDFPDNEGRGDDHEHADTDHHGARTFRIGWVG